MDKYDKLLKEADTWKGDSVVDKLAEAVRELQAGAYGTWCAKLTQQNTELRAKLEGSEQRRADLEHSVEQLEAKLERAKQYIWEQSGHDRCRDDCSYKDSVKRIVAAIERDDIDADIAYYKKKAIEGEE